jgi:hypothetical protein
MPQQLFDKERKNMFSKKKSLFVPAALILTSFLGVSAASAQPPCYTTASLQGSYSIIGNYGANLAISLATEYLDGKGNLTRTAVINEPTPGSTTGDRTIVTTTQTGTYIVNCNGTGTFSRNGTSSNGIKIVGVDDFVITGAVVTDGFGGTIVATTIVDAQRIPSLIVMGGIFLTRTHTRLPDRPGPKP